MTLQLVKDRECGKCYACCVALRINVDTLKKDADIPCKNLDKNKGCAIYKDRPPVCRNWFCAWRYTNKFGDEWRPDRSGIMLRFDEDGGIILQTLKDPLVVLTSELCLSLVASCIESNLSVSISVPTRKGFCSSLVRANEPLKKIIATRNFFAVKIEMLNLIRHASSFPTDPILPLDQ